AENCRRRPRPALPAQPRRAQLGAEKRDLDGGIGLEQDLLAEIEYHSEPIGFLPALTGLILILIGNTNSFLTTSLTLAVGGFLFVTYLSTANSNLQIHTVDRFRGRVMSVYSLIVAGSTPIGNLFVGAMDNWFGARMGFIASDIAVMIFIVPIFVYMLIRRNRV
ncbi:MAG: hypothetical protein EOM63_08360, partial [Clostridia bacterium]|nr:hypothetical protein [Clostridia bacterium]